MNQRRFLCRLLAVCAALCVCLTPLSACGSGTAEETERQPGVTYTDLISDMNREMVAGLTQVMPQILWCGQVDGRLFAYGANETDPANPMPHLLADIDLQNETFTYTALQLPDVPAELPSLVAALAAEEAAGGAAQQAAEYDLPSRTVTGAVKNQAGQLCCVLCDTLQHIGQDADGNTTAAVTERAVTLCALGEGGTLQPLATLQLPEQYRLLSDVAEDCLPGGEDTLWVSATDLFGGQAHLLRFSMTDGRLLSTLSLPQGIVFRQGNVRLLADGRLGMLARAVEVGAGIPQGEVQLYTATDLAGEGPAWQAPVELPPQLGAYGDNMGFVAGDGGQDGLLFHTADGLCSWDLQAEAPTQLLAWKDYGVRYQEVLATFPLADGRYALWTQTDAFPPTQLTMLTPLDPDIVARRKVLTFGTTYYSPLPSSDVIATAVARFNATSDEYYIQVVDYEELAEQRGFGFLNGTGALADAILAGDVPDILMLQTGAHRSLLEKGLTIDLYPYLDADSELTREDFLPNMLGFTEVDDRLASVLVACTLSTLTGDSATVGEDPGWTWEEYQAFCGALNDEAPIWRVDRLQFLTTLVRCGGRRFVDKPAGQAHFDTVDFAALLQASAAYPRQVDMSENDPRPDLSEGRACLYETRMSGWYDLADAMHAFVNGYTFKGYPSDGSSNGCVIQDKLQLGISRSCPYPDAAWQFVRMFLLPDVQDRLGSDPATGPGFPVRQDALDVSAKRILPQLTAGALRPSYLPIGSQMTADMRLQDGEADIEKVVNILENATDFSNFDNTVYTILTEEAEAYYAGQRSAEETAKIIQNRVQTYLDEQG